MPEKKLFDVATPRFMQKSVEWYTPAAYIRLARAAMGGPIDLDPASCPEANLTVQAARYYDAETDGLLQPWIADRLFCNPPYCKSTDGVSNQEKWTAKAIAEYEAGHVKQAIILVNSATETKWFQRLYDYTVCFVRGRIQFNSDKGSGGSPTMGSAFVYFGADPEKFIRSFGQMVAMSPGQGQDEEIGLWEYAEDIA